MSLLDRVRGPGPKALRDAGPPQWQVIAAVLGGGVLDVVLALVAWRDLPLAAYVVPPFILTLAVSLADRTGVPVRRAIAWVGMEQRRRWTGRLPISKGGAERWLADPPPDAGPFERASALLTAGRPADAAAVLERFEPASSSDRVRLGRLRASVAAALDPGAALDMSAVRAAVADLPPAEARYHLVSAAWTQAWLDISRRRPWRERFAAVAVAHQPYELPARVGAMLVVQQFAGPIACVLAGLIVLVIQAAL